VVPGLLAGLTSFSMFSLQADALFGETMPGAAGFVLASMASWVLGVAAGERLGLRRDERLRSAR
jgi:fluoride ion exporter CrcB/FEX